MLVSPMDVITIVFGFVTGGLIRGILVAFVVTIVALFFTDLKIVYPLITFSTIILTSMTFSLAGLLNAIFAKNFDDIVAVDEVNINIGKGEFFSLLGP